MTKTKLILTDCNRCRDKECVITKPITCDCLNCGATWQANQEERKYTEEDIIVFSNWTREEGKNYTTKELFNAWFNNTK